MDDVHVDYSKQTTRTSRDEHLHDEKVLVCISRVAKQSTWGTQRLPNQRMQQQLQVQPTHCHNSACLQVRSQGLQRWLLTIDALLGSSGNCYLHLTLRGRNTKHGP